MLAEEEGKRAFERRKAENAYGPVVVSKMKKSHSTGIPARPITLPGSVSVSPPSL